MSILDFFISPFEFKGTFTPQVFNRQNKRTLKDLNEFRANNWDKSLIKEESYNKYLNLY